MIFTIESWEKVEQIREFEVNATIEHKNKSF